MVLPTTIAWPPLLHATYLALSNLWVPIVYFVRRPKYPDRRSRMTAHSNGLFLPREDVQMKLLQHIVSPLGYLNHYSLVPVVLVWIFILAMAL